MYATRCVLPACLLLAALLTSGVEKASAASAPPWMRAQIGVPLPTHDELTNAVMLYSEEVLTVQANGSIKRMQRVAYKILRPAGGQLGVVAVNYDDQTRITFLRAWCIPATGKDYEVKDKEAVVSAVIGVSNSELISDLRTKLLRIPAAVPGSIVGYEVEQEQRPYMKVDEWHFQETMPVREARYTLQLPPGWSYKATWLNHAEQSPTKPAASQWQWSVSDLKAIRLERDMPPWKGVAGRMSLALLPPSGQDAGLQSWRDIGLWYANLAKDRREASPAIKQKVAELTASEPTPLLKMQALANFVQENIRYVAIELGIGGHQPHRAIDVFTNRYGDCKDKATLLNVMLKEIGIESHYVFVNTQRGAVTATMPPSLAFNHVVLAVALPADLNAPTLLARGSHPKLGNLLFFDPTDTLTPYGRLIGSLQESYGFLVTPDGGELVLIPKLPTTANAIERTATMTLDASGTLRGDVREVWAGDPAAMQRYALRSATKEVDRIKPVEAVAARSFTSFEIEKATVSNMRVVGQPLEWNYTVIAQSYAKVAGDLLLVRPRILGSMSSALLETKEPREHAIELDRPQRDKDVFEITLPDGYQVDELPPAVKLDEKFASYHSKTELVGRKLRYTRTLEILELSVPASEADKLKKFYRIIGNDERMVAVLKQTPR